MVAEAFYLPRADQLALASTIEESLAALLPLSRIHSSPEEDAKTWAGLGEIGIFGISVSENEGGSGLGATEEALIALSLGQRLASPAVLATVGAAPSLALQGRRVAAAYWHNNRSILVNEAGADLVLLRDGSVATFHDLRSCTSKPLNGELWGTELRELTALSETVSSLDASQLVRLRLLDAAALAGIAQATLDMSVSYAGIRKQFGHPIGSFQAVKHACANMAMAARASRDQTCFAAVAVDAQRDDAALHVECALYVAGTAAIANASKNIQIHGGMGFSDEADPHLFLKRAQLLVTIAGGLESTLARIVRH